MRHKARLSEGPRARLGLRARLVLCLLVVILPASMLLLAGAYRRYRDRQSAGLTRARAAAASAAALVQARLDQVIALERLLLSAAGPSGQPGAAGPALAGLLAGHPEYLDAFILDAQGRVVAAAPASRQPQLDSALVAQLASSPSPLVTDLFQGPPDGRPCLQVLVPAWSAEGPAGAAGLTLDSQALGRELGGLTERGALDISLLDRRGWLVYGTADPGLSWESRDWGAEAQIQQALQGSPAAVGAAVSRLDGGTCLAAAAPVPAIGWAVNVYGPGQDLWGYLRADLVGGLVLGLAAALALLAALVGGWFGTPLALLAQHARDLGRGRLNERIEVHTGDEFEGLAAALNSMAGQMEERDRRLRSRTGELEAIITQSADGIAIHGPAGELQRLNPAGIRILGRSPSRLGMSLAEQVACFNIRAAHGSPIDPNELPVAAALRGETRVAQELRVETETGQDRFVAFSASPLSGTSGQIYGAASIFRDMTAAHQAQREKDDFVSLVSHELKTPITSIKGYAQMLLRRAEETGGDERDLKGLRIINDEVGRMVDLINQLLDVSRLETQRLQLNSDRVDLVALTSDAVDRLQMTTNRHTLRLRAPEEPAWVEGDAMRLAQVLGNLIMNAIKYSPAGGPIEVTVEIQEGRGWVSVRDWGIGIAPEDQPHVFQRFYRGSRRGSPSLTGMGLGLYISREIVQRHRGDIVFHSQPGQGATFLFWLPLAKPGESGRRRGQAHIAAGEQPSRVTLPH